MPPHTIKLPNGKFLTGRAWRQDNPLFIHLPFTTNAVYAENDMGDALGPVLAAAKVDCRIASALIVCRPQFPPPFLI